MSLPSSSSVHQHTSSSSSASTPDHQPFSSLPPGRRDTPSNQGSASAPGGSQEIAELSSVHGQEPENSSTSREEGYPSWLPKRPHPPAPQSTLQSNVPMASTFAGDSPRASPEDSYNQSYYGVGRMQTQRSVRIVSAASKQNQGGRDGHRQSRRREATDRNRTFQARVWSRGAAALSPTLLSNGTGSFIVPRPKFNSPNFKVDIVRSTSRWTRLRFYLYPLFVFAHIPLQTFFDFNAVFVLVEVSKFPTPEATGVPGDGRGWAFSAAAYSICWFFWFFIVFILYETVYSFYRRWRIKRPLIAPLYFSSPAYNLVCMTSYNNFSFMNYIRNNTRPPLPFKISNPFRRSSSGSSARSQHSSSPIPNDTSLASWRDYLAETCYFYSQNLPTVVLLLPRAALCLALLLTFWTSNPVEAALGNSGMQNRDLTFFRTDGSLTNYSRGVLIANAAWTAWRTLVLLISWFGLWLASGMACGGICGPRYRWEEEESEKVISVANPGSEDYSDALPWTWREYTRYRIQDAYEFCLTNLPASTIGKKEMSTAGDVHGGPGGATYDGMEQVLAAAGFPSVPLPARRGVLRSELFQTPEPMFEKYDIEQPAAGPSGSTRISTPTRPLNALNYPFVGHPAQASSEGPKIPFPPSPQRETFYENENENDQDRDVEGGGIEEVPIEVEEEDDEDVIDVEEDEEIVENPEFLETIAAAAVRSSDSISSLGQPITSHYPFQFQHARRRGGRSSVGTAQSKSGSSNATESTPSRQSHSTGNRDSSDSPWSGGFDSGPGSPTSPITIPRRHQHPRERVDSSQSPAPPAPPPRSTGRPIVLGGRYRTESASTAASRTFGPEPVYESSAEEDEDVEDDDVQVEEQLSNGLVGQQEAAEQEDSLGLLSATVSPRASLGVLRNRGSSLSSFRSRHNSTGSIVRSRTHSRSTSSHSRSRAESVRSRAQSLIHSIANASISSLPINIRSRANSATRISDPEEHDQSLSGSGSGSAQQSGVEDNTFGLPNLPMPVRLRIDAPSEEGHVQRISEEVDVPPVSGNTSPARLREVPSSISGPTSSLYSERTISAPTGGQSTPQAIAGPRPEQSFISSAHDSYVTAPPSLEGDSDTTGQTPPTNWGGIEHYVPQHGPGQGGNWRPA